eukprot:1790134-Rhodomonas_salina.1
MMMRRQSMVMMSVTQPNSQQHSTNNTQTHTKRIATSLHYADATTRNAADDSRPPRRSCGPASCHPPPPCPAPPHAPQSRARAALSPELVGSASRVEGFASLKPPRVSGLGSRAQGFQTLKSHRVSGLGSGLRVWGFTLLKPHRV